MWRSCSTRVCLTVLLVSLITAGGIRTVLATEGVGKVTHLAGPSRADDRANCTERSSAYFLYQLHTGHTGGSTLKLAHDQWAGEHTSCNHERHLRSFGKYGEVVKYFSEPKSREQQCVGAMLTEFNAAGKEHTNGNYDGYSYNAYFRCTKYFMKAACGVFSYEGTYDDVRPLLPAATLVITFIRNPLFRVASAAEHFRHKRDYTLEQQLHYEQFVNNFCQDGQIHLDKHMGDIEVAVQRLKTLFFIGVTEDYDNSICMLEWQLGLDTSHACGVKDVIKRQNVHEDENISLATAKRIMQGPCFNESVLYSAGVVEYSRRLSVAADLGFGSA